MAAIPNSNVPLVDSKGLMTTQWYRVLSPLLKALQAGGGGGTTDDDGEGTGPEPGVAAALLSQFAGLEAGVQASSTDGEFPAVLLGDRERVQALEEGHEVQQLQAQITRLENRVQQLEEGSKE